MINSVYQCGREMRFIFTLVVLSVSTLCKGQVVFYNSNPINFPDIQESPEAANPYPSAIEVQGVANLVAGLKITLHGFQHEFPDAVDLLLEGPNGINVVIFSDVGAAVDVSGLDIVITDSATESLPDNAMLQSGEFKPTNIGTDDIWPANTPAASANTSLNVFNGFDPNGTWKIYASNDISGAMGSITGGWSITIYTGDQAVLQTGVTNFTATHTHSRNEVALRWLFNGNQSVDAFGIEHSLDQIRWKELKVIKSPLNFAKQSFEAVHKEAVSPKSYYRLRVYKGGSYMYSNIVFVSAGDVAVEVNFRPNPARSHIMIDVKGVSTGKIVVGLVDASGVIMKEKTYVLQNSEPIMYNIDVAPGVYLLRVASEGRSVTKQLVVSG